MTYTKIYNSPLGKIYMNSDGKFLTGLWFANSKDSAKHKLECVRNNLPIFDETTKWLDIYFQGENPTFTPEYKINNLTTFRQDVINIMNKVPYGKTITYNDIAKEIAKNRGIKKMSSQAVGGAVGWNHICIIVPCHRVVGLNGNLTGYGGGIKNKIGLLKLEGNSMDKFFVPNKITEL